ncbi:hypothetical protein ACQKNX_08115 [Lysinibacillus sp. NPDC093712]|uniref:hypothetical protein n=1 Tax=Lysinibacillus sp. NPDC093712 TaxID=3390579 RepID=UPI003D07C3EA
MKNMEIVSLKDDDKNSAILLTLISKLSITRPEDSLQLLAMCAKDDLPKSKILEYTIRVIEDKDNFISN